VSAHLELPGGHYDFWAGHFDPLDPAPSDLDDAFVQLMDAFRIAPPGEREDFTRRLGDSYILQTFAGRAARMGLKTRSTSLVRAGVMAELAMDPHAIDFRDAGWWIPTLHYVMGRLGMNAADEFHAALEVACPSMADALGSMIPRILTYRTLTELRKSELPKVEVDTAAGPGLVTMHIERFEPGYDVLGAIVRAAELVPRGSQYGREEVAVADGFPTVWVFGDWERFKMPDEVRGVGNVHAILRPESTKARGRYGLPQKLWISIADTSSPTYAETLVRHAAEGKLDRAVHYGVAVGSLFGFVQAWIAEEDVPLTETAVTLERFRRPLERILEETPLLPGNDPYELSGISLPGGLLS